MAKGTLRAVSQPTDRGPLTLISEVTARSRNRDLAYYLLSKQLNPEHSLNVGALLTNGDPRTGEVGAFISYFMPSSFMVFMNRKCSNGGAYWQEWVPSLSETIACICQITQRYIPQDRSLLSTWNQNVTLSHVANSGYCFS